MAEAVKSTVKTVLPKEVFSVEINNHDLLQLAYGAYLANARNAHATTKTRGLVSGGGKKPWKQKGTGRARFGSSRNPIWKGGGIAFGPTGNENHTKKLSTKVKRQALCQALTLANQAKKVFVLDVKTTGKTAEIAKFLKANKFDRRTLIVVDEKTPQLLRATNNLENVILSSSKFLNVYNILNADHIVFSASSIETVKAWLTGEVK